MNGNRLAALSINLGREAHAGGRLEIAEAEGGRMLCEVDNTAFGGAVLFQLAESLRHRVGDVEPGPIRTVLTGWFPRRGLRMPTGFAAPPRRARAASATCW